MPQPRLSKLDLWVRHEQRALDVLVEALSLLRAEAGLRKSEHVLNRTLFFCLLKANNQLRKVNRGGFDWPPMYEARSLPDSDDELGAARERKIPDFQWSFIDHAAKNPEQSARSFVIECKRLGKPTRADWILNENYIQNGVLRFIRPEDGYAKNETSAAMVGYIESMEPNEVLVEVNAEAVKAAVVEIEFPHTGWQINGITRLDHEVVRLSPSVALALRHLWVDLRSCISS